MPVVEFLPEGPDEAAPEPQQRPPRRGLSRRLIAVAAALALVGAAVGVVATNGGGPARHRAAAPPSPSPTVPRPSMLALPESVVFGAQAVDVLALDSRIFALTPTLVGVTDRDTGALTVRPAPVGLSNRAGTGRLISDTPNAILWVVAIGGQSIGAYDTQHLDELTEVTAPYPINDAIAMDEHLYFTTDHGLYTAEAGPGPAKRVPGSAIRLGPVGADRSAHVVMAADYASPSRLHVLTSFGGMRTAVLPLAVSDSIAVAGGNIWVSGHLAGQAGLFRLDPATLEAEGVSALAPQLGRRAALVGEYNDKLLVYSPSTAALYCMNAFDGAFKQKWTVPTGAATLNERGLLLATGAGIEQRNARDCLAG